MKNSVAKSIRLSKTKDADIIRWLEDHPYVSFSDLVKTSVRIYMTVEQGMVKPEGIIYVAKREDGVYKIGKTTNLSKRISKIEVEYNANFVLKYAYFVDDINKAENILLSVTASYYVLEEGRRELRHLGSAELLDSLKSFEATMDREGIEWGYTTIQN